MGPMVYIKTRTFTRFHKPYLVLLTMAPRNIGRTNRHYTAAPGTLEGPPLPPVCHSLTCMALQLKGYPIRSELSGMDVQRDSLYSSIHAQAMGIGVTAVPFGGQNYLEYGWFVPTYRSAVLKEFLSCYFFTR